MKSRTIFQVSPRNKKCDRGIAQCEHHPSKFVQAVPNEEGCFTLVLWAELNLVKGRVMVQLREPHVPREGFQALVYKRQWKYVFPGYIIQTPEVQAPPDLTVVPQEIHPGNSLGLR